MLTRRSYHRLLEARGEGLVSIFLPTHRAGPETRQDRIRLKNLLAEARRRGGDRADDALAPADALLDDDAFWRHQEAGLALFAGPDGVVAHRLPEPVDELVFVGERYCVRPLLGPVGRGARFHVLALSRNRVRAIACTRAGASELELPDLPSDQEDALGREIGQKSLQYHTGVPPAGEAGQRAAIFHGHGYGKEDDPEELARFLRRVDDALARVEEVRDAPLVLAAVGEVIAAYRRLSGHPDLVPGGIEGNPDESTAEELRVAALEVARPRLDEPRRAALARLAEGRPGSEVATGLAPVLAAARAGRVATLFARDGGPVWGVEREGDGRVEVHDERRDDDDDLLDRAVHAAHGAGAEIWAASADELPDDEPAAALLRY